MLANSRQTAKKMERLCETLYERMFRRVGEARVLGLYETREALHRPPEGAAYREPGARWGGEGVYGWFRLAWEVPAELAGQALWLRPRMGFYEATLWVDGRIHSNYAAKFVVSSHGNHWCNTMGEGGLILINRDSEVARAEIVREKGTDRARFFRGEVDKYTWVDLGSSYLPSEMNAAYLYAQLEIADSINTHRLSLWGRYRDNLTQLADAGYIELPFVPEHCSHNAHMFYIKLGDACIRQELIEYLRERDICSVFHYVPLHSSPAGRQFGEFVGEDRHTTQESERVLRLPMFYSMTVEKVDYISETIRDFFKER